MHKGKWKKKHPFPFNPNKPKIQRFAHEIQPHALIVLDWRLLDGKKDWFKRFCDCRACANYLRLLETLNPDRYKALCEKRDEENKFFTNKSLPEHVHRRRLLHYSIGNWRS